VSITIFSIAKGTRVVWLRVNEDGSVTYHEEYSDPLAPERSHTRQERTMTVQEAMQDWASCADQIAEAYRLISKLAPPQSP
jgi:hypothetical protein